MTSWRAAENSAERPVKRLVPAPISARARPLAARLAISAGRPESSRNGATGMIAPVAKSRNDHVAAVQADPPS